MVNRTDKASTSILTALAKKLLQSGPQPAARKRLTTLRFETLEGRRLFSANPAGRGLVESDDQPSEIAASQYIHLNQVSSAQRIDRISEPRDTDVFVFSAVEGQSITVVIEPRSADSNKPFLLARQIRSMDPNSQFNITDRHQGEIIRDRQGLIVRETIRFNVDRTGRFYIAFWLRGNSPNLLTGADTASKDAKFTLGSYTVRLRATPANEVKGEFSAERLAVGGTQGDKLPLERRVPPATQRTIGVGIRINGDDDNRNGIADYYDLNRYPQNYRDNDMVKVTLSTSMKQTAGLTFLLRTTNSNLRLWTTDAKGSLVRQVEGGAVPIGDGATTATFWVEWAGSGHGQGDVILVAKNEATKEETPLDEKVHFYTYQSRVIIFSGETAVSGTRIGDADDSGMVDLIRGLWNWGYDINYYIPGDQRTSLRPINDLRTAVVEHGQQNLALAGHSHGGGSVYSLTQDILNAFWRPSTTHVKFTGYVDAIENDRSVDTDSEIRRPWTDYHLNYYQTSPSFGLISGKPTNDTHPEGNIDLSGPLQTHATIDGDPRVLFGLFTQITQRLPNGSGVTVPRSASLRLAPVLAPANSLSQSIANNALFNAAAGKALDAEGNSLGNGTKIQSWDFHDGLNQRWDFERQNDGTFKIRNRAINKVLDAHAPDVGVNGCRVQLWDDLGRLNQRWFIERLPNDQLLIRNAASGKVLDLAAPGAGSNGTALQLWDWNGNVNQKWMLTLPTEVNVAGTDGAEAIVVRDSANGWGYEVVVNDQVTQSGPWTSVRSMLLQGGGGNDSLAINSSAYISRGVVMRLEGNAGDDQLIGGEGTDNLIGGDGNDALYARGGDDRIEGGNGDDWMEAGDGNDQVWGALGNDYIDGGAGNDHLFGEAGDDNMFGNWGFDFLSGGTGGDSISGGGDDDEMRGDEGNDIFWGGPGNDLLTELEGQGTDRFYGESGNDRLYGQAEDTLDGGDGFDQVYSNHIPVGQPIILQLESSGKVVDADSNTPGNTGRVQTYDLLSAAANQAWLLESTGDGYYVIRSTASGLALDANGFESNVNGCRVQMYEYLGGRNQQWAMEMQANRTVLIRNRASGKVLDFHAPAAGLNGTGAQLWDDLGGLNQRFRLAVVG